jgi:hypothetical protein
MLEGIFCYRDAITMLLCNIKGYFSLAMINVLFFALVLLCPAGLLISSGETASMEPLIVSGLFIMVIFVIINFPMLVIASNVVKLDEENRSFAFMELFQTGIPKMQMCSLGIAINFVLFTIYTFVLSMTQVFGDTQAVVAFSALLLIVEIVAGDFLYIYVHETIRLGNFKTSYESAKKAFQRDLKLSYSFATLTIITGLTMAYLAYIFVDGFLDIATVLNNPNVPVDMQLAVLHCLLSFIILILLNTINLTAKGMLIRRIREKEKEDLKYVA